MKNTNFKLCSDLRTCYGAYKLSCYYCYYLSEIVIEVFQVINTHVTLVLNEGQMYLRWLERRSAVTTVL